MGYPKIMRNNTLRQVAKTNTFFRFLFINTLSHFTLQLDPKRDVYSIHKNRLTAKQKKHINLNL